MADNLKEYTVEVGGVPHTMRLDSDDAKRLGAKEASTDTKSVRPANKSRTTDSNK